MPGERVDRAYDAKGFHLFMTFFPEGLIVLFCVICAPVWSFDLIQKGRIIAGTGLLLSAAAAVGAVYVAIVEKKTWIAYAAILGYLYCVVSIMK